MSFVSQALFEKYSLAFKYYTGNAKQPIKASSNDVNNEIVKSDPITEKQAIVGSDLKTSTASESTNKYFKNKFPRGSKKKFSKSFNRKQKHQKRNQPSLANRQRSALGLSDQTIYVDCLIELQRDPNYMKRSSGKLKKKFNQLAVKVKKEQADFMSKTELEWNEHTSKVYFHFTPNVQAYFRKYMDRIICTRVSKYPRFYNLDDVKIPLVTKLREINFTMEKQLLCVGSIPQLVLPNSQEKKVLLVNSEKIFKQIPLSEVSQSAIQTDEAFTKCSLSTDKNIDRILEDYFNVKFVLCSSSMKTLFDNVCVNNTFETEWEIPIVVRNNHETGGKAIFFDSTLPSKSESIRMICNRVNSKASKVYLCHPKVMKKVVKFGQRKQSDVEGGDIGCMSPAGDDIFDGGDIAMLEDMVEERAVKRKSPTKKISSEPESESELLIDEPVSPVVENTSPTKSTIGVFTRTRMRMSAESSDEQSPQRPIPRLEEIKANSELVELEKQISEVEDDDPIPTKRKRKNSAMVITDDEEIEEMTPRPTTRSQSKQKATVKKLPKSVSTSKAKKPKKKFKKLESLDELFDSDTEVAEAEAAKRAETLERMKPPSKLAEITEVKVEEVPSDPFSVGDLLQDQEKMLSSRKKSTGAKMEISAEVSGAESDHINEVGSPKNEHVERIKCEYSTEFFAKPVVEGQNLLYTLWKLGDFDVLIRCSIHCCELSADHSGWDLYSVSAKSEFQPQLSGECSTLSEAARDWIKCAIRPFGKLIKSRIHAFSNEILSVDKLGLKEIEASCPNFKFATNFSVMHHILDNLKGLQEGSYLLSHQKGHGYVRLFKSADSSKRGAHDLRTEQNMVANTLTTKLASGSQLGNGCEYIPLDPNVLLQFHRVNKRVPCTYRPK